MNATMLASFNMFRAARASAQIKVRRSFTDFVADRIVQAVTEPTLLAAVEKFTKLMDSNNGFIEDALVARFMGAAASPEAPKVLAWIRKYPRVMAMVICLKDEEYAQAVNEIDIEDFTFGGIACPRSDYMVGITITAETPLAHGGDMKAGNATIFRRCQVLSTTGETLELPFYSGNALRGQMRDLLADHYLRSLDLVPNNTKPPCSLWFFHALYAGGALEEQSAQAKAIAKKMGDNGAVKAEGMHELRDLVPPFSVLGTALGNRIISGRVNVGDALPRCIQWGTGAAPVDTLMTWEYLTRREDHEGHADDDHHGMIANTECLRAGVVLDAGLDISDHVTDVENSCVGKALELLAERGYIGAENRRGFGKVKIELRDAPSGKVYDAYLMDNKDKIIKYLTELGAINACRQSDIFGDQE